MQPDAFVQGPLQRGERLVNHASARTEMEETYDLYTYLPEMREAMKTWEAFVRSVCIEVPASLRAA
jgi:hypothetical protein